MSKIRLHPRFHAEIIPPEGAYLLTERGHVVVKGEVSCRLAELLDGTLTAERLAERLSQCASYAEVLYTLELMKRAEIIEEVEASEFSDRVESLSLFFNLRKRDCDARLLETPVGVRSFGGVPTAAMVEALNGLGIRISRAAETTIVLTDDYLQPGIREFNDQALKSGTRWLLAKPVGTILWIGPVFVPGKTACWECMAQRISGNREVESYLQRRLRKDAPFPTSRISLTSTVQIGMHLAALMTARLVFQPQEYEAGVELITLDTLTLQLQHHAVVRRPQCPRCGWLDRHPDRLPEPLKLFSQKKRFTNDGGHRSVRPEETVKRYIHHVGQFMGAVTQLERVATTDSNLMHVYAAGHNFAVRNSSLNSLRKGLRHSAAGKGATDAQAKASALCEALERYSGIFCGDEPRVRRSYSEMGDRAIHPNACMLYSDKQFLDREIWNARDSNFQVIPQPFDECAQIEWSPVWSLTRNDFRYLPTSYLYYGYPQTPNEFFCWADSNGNAAGNNLEEAILQGFLELVERDSVCLWWYNRARRSRVDVRSFEDPYIDAVLREYEELSRPIWVLDVTSDLRIPAFAAISRRTDKKVEDILVAFGAHFVPEIALRRAVTELNQFLPAVLSIQTDGTGAYAFPDPECQHWWKTATLNNQPFLAPDPEQRVQTRSDYNDPRSSDDIMDDLLVCRAIVERLGMEMLVLDLTRPDIGLSTVKVIVPGLRHFWARFAPGRLYDVPVKLGWVRKPLVESELNPIPVFV